MSGVSGLEAVLPVDLDEVLAILTLRHRQEAPVAGKLNSFVGVLGSPQSGGDSRRVGQGPDGYTNVELGRVENVPVRR